MAAEHADFRGPVELRDEAHGLTSIKADPVGGAMLARLGTEELSMTGSTVDDELGVIEIIGDQAEARLIRSFDHPPQRVWAALTQSPRLVEWLAPGSIQLSLGGAVKLDFTDSGIVIDSRVSAFVPGRLLEYSWSGPGEPLRPIRWEIEAVGCGTRLTLTLTLPACEDVARSCAGWEAHLEMLAAALEGVPIKFPFERFKASREAYKARMSQPA